MPPLRRSKTDDIAELTAAALKKPLRAPAGIAKDIGQEPWDSNAPSPVRRKHWSVGTAFTKPRADPWLASGGVSGVRNSLCVLPPNSTTYDRFKGKFDAWLLDIQANPAKLQREISKRRVATWGRDTNEEVRWFSKGFFSSDTTKIERDAANERQHQTQQQTAEVQESVECAPPHVAKTERVAAPRRSKSSLATLAEGIASSCAPSPSSKTRQVIHDISGYTSTTAGGMSFLDSCQPFIDGTASEDGTVMPTPMGLRTGSPQLLNFPNSSPGLPSSSTASDRGFNPPSRKGWMPLAQGPWHHHPEDPDWLFQAAECVFFHIPSDTLWREDVAGTADGVMRIQLAATATEMHHLAGKGYRAIDDDRVTPKREMLSRHGWMPVREGSTWLEHPSHPGWMQEPYEDVFFHLDTESLWCEDFGCIPDTDAICVCRVGIGDGREGRPGTPISLRAH